MRRMPVNRQCADKIGHETEAEAGEARRRMLENTGTHPDALRYYQCPRCKLWHIGRISVWARKRRATTDEGRRSQEARRRRKGKAA